MIFKNKISRIALQQILPIGILLAGVSSCSVSQSIAGETDGIYYDPATDQKPVYTSTTTEEDYYYPNGDESLVRIGGKYFDRNGNAPIADRQTNTYDHNRNNRDRNPRYSNWGEEEESNVNVSVNYFGSPFYSGFGWGISYGYGAGSGFYSPWGGYSPYFNSVGYWNSPYYGYGYNAPFYNSWDPFYSPYYNYSPFYGNPYYGYYGHRYNPYYGYGGGYGYYGNGYYPGYYRTKPIERGRRPSSNDVDIYRNTQRYNNGRVQNSRSENREIRRTYSADNNNSNTYRRVRENNSNNNNNQSRIRYNRSSDSNSWNSARSSNWGNSNSRSYTPSSSTRSSNNSSSGRVRFK